LYAGTVIGFLCSAALVVSVHLPQSKAVAVTGSIYAKTFRGISIYLRTPRLRGLLALNLAAAAANSMVIVNTVVYVQSKLGRPSADVPLALAAFGLGSMLMALLLPKLLDKRADRPAMLIGAAVMAVGLGAGCVISSVGGRYEWFAFLGTWFVVGLGYSTTLTPSGRLLRRSSTAENRPAVFAAQFSLSHVCWLITYPLAGFLGAKMGMPVTFGILAILTFVSVVLAALLWPEHDPDIIEHLHAEGDQVHVAEGASTGRGVHRNAFTIDRERPR
jgi:MFS family permease